MRDFVAAALITVAMVLVAVGAGLFHVGAGLIVGGAELVGWVWLIVWEPMGPQTPEGES